MLVLLVDDDASIRRSLQAVLEEEGYRVVVAAHGGEAASMLIEKGVRPDLVLLDLMMPIMDGWTFLDRVAEHPELAAVPVVVMSASIGEVSGGTISAARAYLRKPVGVQRLLSVVKTFAPGEARA